MKIVSCYIDRSEIGPLAEAGADELYTSAPGLPSYAEQGLCPRQSLPAAFRDIHALGRKALVAINSPFVHRTAVQMKALLAYIRGLDEAGADAFIISNPGLMSALRAGRPLRARLHLSSVQPCFNTAALRFFLRFGISRVILPSQLAPREAAPLLAACRREGIETEIFDYRFFGCVYVNGRCNLHSRNFHTFRKGVHPSSLCRCGGSLAGLPVKASDVPPGLAARAAAVAARVSRRMGGGGAPRFYNAASFYDFYSMGAGWLKYGTRLDPLDVKVRKVRAMRGMIDLAGSLGPGGRDEFIERMTAWKS